MLVLALASFLLIEGLFALGWPTLIVRAEPSQYAKSAGEVPFGATVHYITDTPSVPGTVLGLKGTWRKVRYIGFEGWAFSEWLSPIPPCTNFSRWDLGASIVEVDENSNRTTVYKNGVIIKEDRVFLPDLSAAQAWHTIRQCLGNPGETYNRKNSNLIEENGGIWIINP